MKGLLTLVAVAVVGVGAVACDKGNVSADVNVKSDKPGDVTLNGKNVDEVKIHSDAAGTTVNGKPGDATVNVGAGGVNVAANTGTGAAPGDPKAEAEQIFSQRCSVCHGMSGKGDGPGAAALNPKPRNYTDAAWQGTVTDDQIAKTIVEGGAAVGKSPLMAPNADLKDKPEVVKALVAKVRSFKGAT